MLILPATIVFAHAALAQQQFNAPQLLNPAMTGFTPADVRASFTYSASRPYRYAPTYSSATFAADAPVLQGKLPKGDAIGVGISSTYSGYNGNVNAKNIGLSAAYHKALGKKHDQYLSLGVQGLVNTWPPRDSMGRTTYPIYRAGAMYARSLAGNVSVYGGYSISRVGNPTNGEKWENTTAAQLTRHTVLAGGVWNINKRFSLNASAIIEAVEPRFVYNFTAMAGYTPNPDSKYPTTLYLGNTYNFGKGYGGMVAPYLGVEKWGFRLAVSPYMNPGLHAGPLRMNSYQVSLLWLGRFKKHSEKHKDAKPFPRIY